MKRFSDKKIMITGASSGIGKSLAIKLSNEGAGCVLVARNEERLDRTRMALNDPEKHLIIPSDISEAAGCQRVFEEMKKKSIILDGMVHCAGIARVVPLRAISEESELEMFRIHYFAFIELVRQYAKKRNSNGGSIVAISSINAHVPQKCMTSYASAKAAVESSCRTLALELVDKNIRINSVVVGGIKTEMSEDVSKTVGAVHSNYDNPTRRQILGIGTADDIIGAIEFLLSEESRFITGRELYVDGGLF